MFPARSGSESESGKEREREKAPVVRRERSDTTAGKEAVENVRRCECRPSCFLVDFEAETDLCLCFTLAVYHPEETQS